MANKTQTTAQDIKSAAEIIHRETLSRYHDADKTGDLTRCGNLNLLLQELHDEYGVGDDRYN